MLKSDSIVSVWYVSKYLVPQGLGSAGSRGYWIMHELARLGHKVAIITSDSNHLANAPSISGGHIIHHSDNMLLCWVKTLKYRKAKSFRRVLSWLHFELQLILLPKAKLSVPDVVIVSSLSLLTVIQGFLWRFQYGCRLIFEVRDIWPLTLCEEGGFSRCHPLVALLSAVEWLGYKYSDAIVGTMPNLGAHVEAVLGCKKEVYCVPMGIDPSLALPSSQLPNEFSKKYIPQNKFIVAHVGSIGLTNALEPFLECASLMHANNYIHFLLVGDGDMKPVFQERCAHFSNVSFAPRVAKDMVQSVLSRCDLLYFSTYHSRVWEYGQSLNKLIDYMFAGKPIVASFSGYASMVNEAGCGTFVEAEDPRALMLELERYSRMSPDHLSTIGSAGRSWLLERRPYATLASDYLDIIFKVLLVE